MARDVWPAALLAALAIPVILVGLGSYSVVNGDEALYHGVAQEMVDSGNWLRIEFRGEHRVYDTFVNAPLQYWVRAALISIFGSNYWTMRILSALFGIATVLTSYRLALYLADRRAAFLAGLVLLTTFHFVFIHSARTGELETLVAFFITLSAYLFLRGLEEGRGFISHHLCLIALLNLKSPLVLLPLITELVVFAVLPVYRAHFARWARSAALVLPLGLVWHVGNALALWDPFREVTDVVLGQAFAGPHWSARLAWNARYYGSTLLFAAFPYVLVYPLAIAGVFRAAAPGQERRRWLVVGLFAATVAVFFLALEKQLRHYIIPLYPFLSVFVGGWLARLSGRRLGPIGALYLGLAGAALLAMDVRLTTFNPFATRSFELPLGVRWRSPPGLGAAAGVALSGALGAALLIGLARWQASRRALPTLIAAALLGVGLVRVAMPLRHLGHQTEMALLRERLDEARRVGEPIAFPIEIAESGPWRALFYFGRDFRVVAKGRRTARRTGVSFELYEKEPLTTPPEPR
ncbi:MAG: glycosyltransferase family 39 protein [Myxococcota bacterium]